MSGINRAGAAAFVAAPLLALAGALVVPTLSDEAPDRVAALLAHRGAETGGLTLQMIALGLMVAGSVWLALAVAPRAPRLAVAGGVLAVFAYFVIAFENGVALAAAGIVPALEPSQAVTALHAVEESAGVAAVEPLSIAEVIGYSLLAVGLRRTASPLWAGALLVAASAVQTAGFATGTAALVVAGFAGVALAALGIVRALAGRPAAAPAPQPATAP
ncbi:MAG TPA: hypothetical protein VFJ77_08010 [Gaiellaceae bacterium]|nr:hypothetical protein [Gaiellaceae bacterium]